MERREFLTALCAGLGASFATSQALALPHLSHPALPRARSAPRQAVATDLDLDAGKVEKTFGGGYWRHRRRRARRYGRD